MLAEYEVDKHPNARLPAADTMTAPTPQMLEYALRAASLGDDVMGWDYCTTRLEEHVAKLCGKEVCSPGLSDNLALTFFRQESS